MLKDIKKKMGEIIIKADQKFERLFTGPKYDCVPVVHEFIDDNGEVFGRSEGFVWVKVED